MSEHDKPDADERTKSDEASGDFAEGERTLPLEPEGDFAEGERSEPPGPRRDFGEGVEEKLTTLPGGIGAAFDRLGPQLKESIKSFWAPGLFWEELDWAYMGVIDGHDVRAMTRRPEDYGGAGTQVAADVSDEASLRHALEGCDAAYYLVHSLGDADFQQKDAEAARAFARAAADAGVGRIIYLGGLGRDGDQLSPHLRGRR